MAQFIFLLKQCTSHLNVLLSFLSMQMNSHLDVTDINFTTSGFLQMPHGVTPVTGIDLPFIVLPFSAQTIQFKILPEFTCEVTS
jgi:hypothetical protein